MEDKLSEELLKGTVLTGHVVEFDYIDNEFVVRTKDPIAVQE